MEPLRSASLLRSLHVGLLLLALLGMTMVDLVSWLHPLEQLWCMYLCDLWV